jgi:hypothetical protein
MKTGRPSYNTEALTGDRPLLLTIMEEETRIFAEMVQT